LTKVPALIVTLATMEVFRGAGGHITRQQNINVPQNLRGIGTGSLLGFPAPVLSAAVVALGGAFVLARTVFGRYLQAVGSSPSAAANAGLPVRKVIAGAYVVAGLLGGIASLTETARLSSVRERVFDHVTPAIVTKAAQALAEISAQLEAGR